MSESWGTPGGGWGNPAFGSTSLRLPAINSPNFNLANPTASPSPSWAILANGLAYFFGVVLSGGTITGPDYVINTSGFFFYSGTPASGNLVGSSVGSSGGTDSFGNVYQPGDTVYIANGGYVNINSSGGIGGNTAIIFHPGLTSHVSENPQVYGASNNSGLANEFEFLTMTSGAAGTGDTTIQLLSPSADGTLGGVQNFFVAGTLVAQLLKTIWDISVPISCTLGTPANPSIITNGAYTRIPSPFSNGWVSGGGAGDMNGIIYRMSNDGNFEVWLDIINPNAQVNSIVTTFSAPFIPQKNQKHEIAGSIAGAVWATLDTSGNLIMTGNTGANQEINGRCMFYLGAIPLPAGGSSERVNADRGHRARPRRGRRRRRRRQAHPPRRVR